VSRNGPQRLGLPWYFLLIEAISFPALCRFHFSTMFPPLLRFTAYIPTDTPTVSPPSPENSDPHCAFIPHNQNHPFVPTSPALTHASRIPGHAWPQITQILSNNLSPILTSSRSGPLSSQPSPQETSRYENPNLIRTLDLGLELKDASLEGVRLGLVFVSNQGGREELRRRAGRETDKECLDEAIRKVEGYRQMEGVLEVEGRGRMSFLVFRVD
jgi:hypothetical protein